MASFPIRVIGDPVLKEQARDVQEIDGSLVKLVDDMFVTMHEAPGLGLAAPQVGVQKRFFIYDLDDRSGVLINPRIEEAEGEWTYNEGCLSIPGLYFEITRPGRILIAGIDLDGNEVELEAEELWGRLFQHELDHLDGKLMIDHLTEAQRKAAKKEIRQLIVDGRRPAEGKVILADGSELTD